MQNKLSTVAKLFIDNLYRIPDYQRGYAWGDRQLKDFWSDIEQLAAGKSHYTGVLTLERVPESVWKTWHDDIWIIEGRTFQPYYVVDGQQRLTTIVVLIQCIVEAMKNDQKIAFQNKEAIRSRYLFDSKGDDISRSYFFGYEKDNPSYEYLKTKIFCEPSTEHSTKEETIYTKNLRDAKIFFLEKLENLTQKELESVFQKVSQQLLFNTYEIAEEVDVFVTFETMNNRGKALSSLELLKNRLIYLSTRMAGDRTTLSSLRRAINEAWKDIYHFLGRNENRPLADDVFLQRHLYLYFARDILKINDDEDIENREFIMRQRRTIERNGDDFLLDKLFSPKRIGEILATGAASLPKLNSQLISTYAADLKKYANQFYELSSPGLVNSFSSLEKIWIERLNRLVGYEATPICLFIAATEKSVDKKIKFYEAYERFVFIRELVAESTLYQRSAAGQEGETLQLINGKKKLDEFIQYLDNMVDLWTGSGKEFQLSETLSEWAKNGSAYYGWRRVKYFLFEYEMDLKVQSKTDRLKLDWDKFFSEKFEDDFESVEHIYPQRARSPYWTSKFEAFSVRDRAAFRNSLGNLLALSIPKNSSLSNKPFPEKLANPANTTGYKFGCYSENEVALLTDWTPQSIVDRGVKMLTFFEKRWSLNIGDRHSKIRALGLDFSPAKGIK
jgi:uncharacterized protein with ParB-like and HNH nuclease domain